MSDLRTTRNRENLHKYSYYLPFSQEYLTKWIKRISACVCTLKYRCRSTCRAYPLIWNKSSENVLKIQRNGIIADRIPDTTQSSMKFLKGLYDKLKNSIIKYTIDYFFLKGSKFRFRGVQGDAKAL
jgi:hypothetical protein